MMAPFVIFFIGAAVVMLVPQRLRNGVLLLTPLIGLGNLLTLDWWQLWHVRWFGLDWILFTIDRTSFLFGILFHIATIIGVIFAWHVKDRPQQAAALLYPGSALGAVFAGDFLTLFVFWECLALSSVCFITATATPRALRAALRYLIFQITSGVLLLLGAVMLLHSTGRIAITPLTLGQPVAWLFFIAFGIKAAFPLLHNWLTDGYPEATPSGCVFLSACTTKVAIYALARVFSGEDALIYIGVVMACFPIFYAVIENDLRRVLGYSMINQLGFMVCGIGIGSELAVNGAVAHAFNDVIFKGLLMMSMGAVLWRTGEMRGSHLGGLARTMPKTAGLCMIGAASISAFPLFSGFVSKSMVMAALLLDHHEIVWLGMLFASAGVFHHAGIKIPYFAFFAHDSGRRPAEAPPHMLIAMALAACLCIGIGSFPAWLYQHLPFAVAYTPFTLAHVTEQMQLLFFSALAFIALQLCGRYPPELKSINIDSEWLYRRAIPKLHRAFTQAVHNGRTQLAAHRTILLTRIAPVANQSLTALLRPWPVSTMTLLGMTLFIITLLMLYVVA